MRVYEHEKQNTINQTVKNVCRTCPNTKLLTKCLRGEFPTPYVFRRVYD